MTKEELKQEAEEYASKGGLPKEKHLFGVKVIAYLAGAESREKRIAELTEQNTSLLTSVENLNKSVQELEAEVKEWKDKADLWCKTANLKDHNILRTKELVQENAELKNNFKIAKDNEYEYLCLLTKAKDLLKKVADVCGYPNYDIPVELYADIEQFLKE